MKAKKQARGFASEVGGEMVPWNDLGSVSTELLVEVFVDGHHFSGGSGFLQGCACTASSVVCPEVWARGKHLLVLGHESCFGVIFERCEPCPRSHCEAADTDDGQDEGDGEHGDGHGGDSWGKLEEVDGKYSEVLGAAGIEIRV